MKGARFFFITMLFVGSLFSACNNSDDKKLIPSDVVNNPNTANGEADDKLAIIQFEKTEHDFGKIMQGEKIRYAFKFKNAGKADLLISSVNASCGCTVADYPKEPIAPGAEGVISVQFDSEGKHGVQDKTITVNANTQPSSTVLHIKSFVQQP